MVAVLEVIQDYQFAVPTMDEAAQPIAEPDRKSYAVLRKGRAGTKLWWPAGYLKHYKATLSQLVYFSLAFYTPMTYSSLCFSSKPLSLPN
jgi:hypothetical protein